MRQEQWTDHITLQQLRWKWGDDTTMSAMVARRRLQWLGHLAHMPERCIPKTVLFGWLCQPRPTQYEVERYDTKVIEVDEKEWYEEVNNIKRKMENNVYSIFHKVKMYTPFAIKLKCWENFCSC